ncbi:MAG: hypothetical protein JNM20_15140 [Rhizobiales bacterium]|nr:hypothetical protein [Hyphomicrobiales bacterium]
MRMMLKLLASAVICAGLTGTAVAQEKEIPNLVGVWKGKTLAVHIGANPYRVADGNGVQFPTNEIEFTYDITEQHDKRFAGKSSGGKFSETIIGMLAPDGHTAVMLDDDGQYAMTLVDPNTIDMCYHHLYPTTKVVACWQIKRTP